MSVKIVITTIQEPTKSVQVLIGATSSNSCELIVIGDEKGPFAWPADNSKFFSLEDQRNLPFVLAKALPTASYSRKNLGYLEAIRCNASSIFETDDDNAPTSNWHLREINCSARKVKSKGWINTYRYFTDERIWPRGFPISKIRESAEIEPKPLGKLESVKAPIQQALVSGSPDVDAIWRLVMDREIHFRQEDSIFLPAGAWCPFNSQSTWWFPEAYPLMYLPSFVSFRMTDIWRSFVAQRCLWAMGYGLVFHGPEMIQDRNYHDLNNDFEQEIPGYLDNERIRAILADCSLDADDVCDNLRICYQGLVDHQIVPAEEMQLLECWIADYRKHAQNDCSGILVHEVQV